jgi:lipopolysaccharide transport system ATP-binding protein
MNNAVISVRDVSKCYPVFDSARSRVLHTLWPKYERGVRQHWALRDIDFEVKKGESVAIIGRNGGGKSTLLEILTGTLKPTKGSVSVCGRVSALLELGSGFNPEYSGRDNVLLNGLLLGLSREEILARFSEIEEFAEIGDAIDRPVKTYSSGMMMRLAFSVQVLCDPDILIVDEALSVGDFFFQQKCFNRLREMREKGLTLLFVSHDMGTVRDLCQRAVYLRNGEQVYVGETQIAVRRYFAESSDAAPTPPVKIVPLLVEGRLPEFEDVIAWSRPPASGKPLFAVRVLDGAGCDTTAARLGDTVKIRVYFRGCGDIENLRVSLVFKNRYDQIINSSNSTRLGFERIVLPDRAWSAFEFEVDLRLEGGLYSLRVALSVPSGQNRATELDSTNWFGPLEVRWDYENEAAPFLGMFGLPVRGATV